MDLEQSRKIEALYEAALKVEPAQRATFLAENCADDESLRREVESLLLHDDNAGSFLEVPALEMLPDRARPAAGQRLSHYEIVEKLGEGGMGFVYKARDTRLGRSVALKFVKAQFSERFEREARAIAALNHPHIATLYEVGEHEGAPYLAMEFVEGNPLKGPRPVKEVIEYGIQVADALAAAHAAGIVHRDLKPGNILVTQKGSVKILDFGVAKLRARVGDGAPATATLTGMSAGTPGYMSPEQIDGKPADARSDIFSFGCVLYELASGRHAFEGDSVGQVLGATATTEPKPVDGVPEELEKLIRRCLRKDPARRFQHMADVRVALEELKEESDSGALVAAASPRWSFAKSVGLGLGILASVLVLLIALNVGRLRERVLGRANTPRITSLAVLPVKNFSGDPSQEFFADGMTDTLIAGLAQIKAVNKVISRTSVMQYKDAKKSLPQIARELGVDGIVEASVMRSGGRVRVTARLIDARQDRQLWGNDYEREMTDVLALQSELVQAIAGEIRVQVTPQESERLKTARLVDPEVYDATLKGKATLEYATREGEIRQAIELFQKAVDRDPTYAPAWAGLGEAMWALAAAGLEFVAPGEVRDKAIAAAEKALDLDETLPDAHKARAVIAFDGEWDVAKAQRHFGRALELRPGYAAAHNLYGQMLASPLLRFDEARRHYDRARELDPLSPWNDINLGWWWLYQGRPERALEEGERARRRDPTIWVIRWYMGFAQLLLGQPSQAVSEFDAALELLRPDRPAAVLAPLGLAYGLAGRRADALKILAEMEHASQKGYISPVSLAVVYSGLGRMDEAFRLLDRALEQRTPSLVWCTPYAPNSVALRRDPRWKPFIDRLRRLVRLPPGTPDPYS